MTSESQRNPATWLVAVTAGALLAIMIKLNGQLAQLTTAPWASLVAHGIGAAASFLVYLAFFRRTPLIPEKKSPLWVFTGGLAGGLVVVLASMTVNSNIGLTGTISLMLLGQVIFGLGTDLLGWFGLPKRRPSIYDFGQVLLIMSGSALLIFFAK